MRLPLLRPIMLFSVYGLRFLKNSHYFVANIRYFFLRQFLRMPLPSKVQGSPHYLSGSKSSHGMCNSVIVYTKRSLNLVSCSFIWFIFGE